MSLTDGVLATLMRAGYGSAGDFEPWDERIPGGPSQPGDMLDRFRTPPFLPDVYGDEESPSVVSAGKPTTRPSKWGQLGRFAAMFGDAFLTGAGAQGGVGTLADAGRAYSAIRQNQLQQGMLARAMRQRDFENRLQLAHLGLSRRQLDIMEGYRKAQEDRLRAQADAGAPEQWESVVTDQGIFQLNKRSGELRPAMLPQPSGTVVPPPSGIPLVPPAGIMPAPPQAPSSAAAATAELSSMGLPAGPEGRTPAQPAAYVPLLPSPNMRLTPEQGVPLMPSPAALPGALPWQLTRNRKERELSAAEDLKNRIAAAYEKGDGATVKKLQDELKAIDPLGAQRLQITIGQKGEEEKAIEIAARSLAAGDLSRLRDIASMRGSQRLLVYARAKELNPNFNTAQVDRRTKMLENYTTGKQGDQLQSFGTFLEHAGALADTMAELKASGPVATMLPILNKPLNWLRQNVSGNPAYQKVLAALDPVEKEFESYLLNNRALYSEDRATVDKIVNGDLSPNQLMGALEQMGHTVQARYNEADKRFRNTMGKGIEELVGPLSDEAKAGAARIGVRVGMLPARGEKVYTQAEVEAVAARDGVTTDQVEKGLKAKGWKKQ